MAHDPNLRFILFARDVGVSAASFQVLAGDLELATEAVYIGFAAASPTFSFHHPLAARGLVDDIAAWLRGQAAAGTETPDQREEWVRRLASALGGPEYPPPPRVRPVPDRLPPRRPAPPPTQIAQTPLNLNWVYALLPAVCGIVFGGTFLLLCLLVAVTPAVEGQRVWWAWLIGAAVSAGVMAAGIGWTLWLFRPRPPRR